MPVALSESPVHPMFAYNRRPNFQARDPRDERLFKSRMFYPTPTVLRWGAYSGSRRKDRVFCQMQRRLRGVGKAPFLICADPLGAISVQPRVENRTLAMAILPCPASGGTVNERFFGIPRVRASCRRGWLWTRRMFRVLQRFSDQHGLAVCDIFS